MQFLALILASLAVSASVFAADIVVTTPYVPSFVFASYGWVSVLVTGIDTACLSSLQG